jgi:hypothetical protein
MTSVDLFPPAARELGVGSGRSPRGSFGDQGTGGHATGFFKSIFWRYIMLHHATFLSAGAHSNDVDQSFQSDADQFGAKRRMALLV